MFAARNAMMTSGVSLPKGSVYFDGTGDYLIASSSGALGFGLSDYTAEMWIKPDSRSTSQILISANTIGGGWGLRLGTGYNAGALAGLNVFLPGQGDAEYCSYTFTAGQWYHIAVVRASGASAKFYINGTGQTTSGTSTGTTSFNNETQTGVGAYPGGGEDYKGYISNLRVVKSAVYTANFTTPASPLTAISNTTLLTAHLPTTISDASTNNWTVTAYGNAAASSTSPF